MQASEDAGFKGCVQPIAQQSSLALCTHTHNKLDMMGKTGGMICMCEKTRWMQASEAVSNELQNYLALLTHTVS
jgi:hypothetical protein